MDMGKLSEMMTSGKKIKQRSRRKQVIIRRGKKQRR
jgi:hypothetical protein